MALKNLTPEKLTQSSFDDRAFFHLFKSHSAIMLLIEPRSGVIIEANLAALNFYGYPKKKLCGMSMAEINILPSEQVEAERQKAKNEGRNYIFMTQRLSNGQERKVEDFFSNFIYRQKHLLFSIVNDITERSQAEDTLLSFQKFRAAELVIAYQDQELSFQNDEKENRAAELVITNAYLENLINSASAPIIVWDPQLCITRFNHAFEFLTGRSEAEMLGQTLEVLFPSALVNKTMAQIRKSLLVGRGESVEIKILHRDASVRTVLWNFATLYEPDGKTPLATIAQGQDITRRKQMEVALTNANLDLEKTVIEREAALKKLEKYQIELKAQNQDLYDRQTDIVGLQERYFNLYDLAPVGYCTLNADGLILEANLTAANLLGVTRESMRNCPLSRFIERNSQDLYYFHRKKFIKTGMLTVDELQMVNQDGAIFWAQVESSLILTDRNELQARILISDISERKRIQKLLQITEKRMSVLAEYGRVITWEVDAEGLYTYISQSCVPVLGYTPDEIKDKKHFYDLYPELGRTAMKAAAFEVFDRQIPFHNFENVLQTRYGRVIWVLTNALPILDESGKLTGYSGVNIDITERKQAEAAELEHEAGKREQAVLAKADAERRLLLDNIHTQVWYMTDDHTYGIVNAAHAAFVGVSKDSLAFKRLYDFIQKDRVGHFTQDVKQVFATGQAIRSEFRLPNADAEWRLLNILMSPILNIDGLVQQVVCSAEDISERKQAEEALRYTHWKLESTIEGTHVGTWEWNVQTGETTFNEIWAQFIGYSLAELVPANIKTWEVLTHPDDLIRSGAVMERHFTGELSYYDCELRMKHKDGHWVWLHDRGRVITRTPDNKPLLMFGTHTDISERKASEEKIRVLNSELENLSLTDYLTNLFNRRYFMLRGAEAIKLVSRNEEPLALLMLDIDWFKKVNDNYGHEVGDLALQHVAAVLKFSLREIDILARMGGEEFAVLLPNTTQNEAVVLAERVRKLMQDTSFETTGKSLSITVSIGAAVFENGMLDIDDLLRNADLALYEAKRSGRNRVVLFENNPIALMRMENN